MTVKEIIKNTIQQKINGQHVTTEMLTSCMDYIAENIPDMSTTTLKDIADTIEDWKHQTLVQCDNCQTWDMRENMIEDGYNFYCSTDCQEDA